MDPKQFSQQNYSMKNKKLASSAYPEFPSKTYRKRKEKVNVLMNKMETDTGYPQDILINAQTSRDQSKHKQINYLMMNTKNLKNFFSQRLPPKEAEIYRMNQTIDPSKMFNIKRKQYQLKLETKITLENTIDTDLCVETVEPERVMETFLLKDKNLEFRKKFLLENSLNPKREYTDNNFRRGTQSFSRKYANITKKVAYNSTFGPEQAQMYSSRKYAINEISQKPRPSSLASNRFKQRNKKKQQEILLNNIKFSSGISKLDQHRKSLDPDDRTNRKPYQPREFKSNQIMKQKQKGMIQWISATTNNYKKEAIDEGLQNLEELEDLKKMDQSFYQELMTHKAKRLKVRESQISHERIIQSSRNSRLTNSLINQHTENPSRDEPGYRISPEKAMKQDLSISVESEEQSEVNDQNHIKGNWGYKKKLSVIEKFQKFGHQLVITLYKAKSYGITDKNNIYKAFWMARQPYQLEGSYAFFKAIKKNDVEGVKKFLQLNDLFLYEKDHKKRSPLIYCCQNNHTELAKFLMSQEINFDLTDTKNKTALYYSIDNQNIELTEILLRRGCSPWSSPSCDYKSLVEQKDNLQLRNLMKNARKIWLAAGLIGNRARKHKIWVSLKQHITTDSIISFT